MILTDVDMESWKRSRSFLLVNFSLGAFAFGLSLTVYFPTEYYYFKDTMKVKDPELFYGLSWAFLSGSGLVLSLVGGYYTDLTKNVREICLLANVMNVIGNIMYVLYYSPYLVLFGQLLVGSAAARVVAFVGELSRVYEPKDLTQKLSILAIFSTFGSVLGPCTTYVFKFVNTEINGWKLNINNMVGITMATLYFIEFILDYFTLKNVSKVYNLKQEASKEILLNGVNETENEDETSFDSSDEGISSNTSEESFYKKYMIALKAVFRCKHVLFLNGLFFFASYTRATVLQLHPIKSEELLSWKQTDLATFYIVSACVGAIPTAIVLTFISQRVDDFLVLLFALLTNLTTLILMAVFPLATNNYTIGCVTLYADGIMNGMSTSGFHIITRSMLAKFVPENIQTSTEAIRSALSELSYMVAGIAEKLPSTYFIQSIFGMTIIMSFAIAWYLADEKVYRNIKIIRVYQKL